MNAIYKGKLYMMGDELQQCEIIDPETGVVNSVDFGDPDLIVDPTDQQIFANVPDERTSGLIRLKTPLEKIMFGDSKVKETGVEGFNFTPKEKEAASIVDLLCPLIVADGHYVGPELFKRLTLRLAELLD
jgi:hypothetical protein